MARPPSRSTGRPLRVSRSTNRSSRTHWPFTWISISARSCSWKRLKSTTCEIITKTIQLCSSACPASIPMRFGTCCAAPGTSWVRQPKQSERFGRRIPGQRSKPGRRKRLCRAPWFPVFRCTFSGRPQPAELRRPRHRRENTPRLR